jgi:hypothetical protein
MRKRPSPPVLRRLVAICAASIATAVLPRAASAFCGFYVSGADAKLFNDATQVALMREGTRTVLSMQNDYQGPPEAFAMVVPVPVVLQKENVKTLPKELFAKLDQLTAPRLVEYWEQDPCAPQRPEDGFGIGLGGIGSIGRGGGGAGYGHGGVKIEAQFAVGEYEIVILSAKDSTGLDAWLRDNHYNIPAGAEPYLRPYVAAGSKFFVAKVDVTKVKFEDGRAALSPLRVHYDADTFSLPVRLGLVNSKGTQDLIVYLLAKNKRYEAANYGNVFIPTNLDVSEKAKPRFGEFYAALFDRVLEKNPKSVVTEYSWDAGTCDPCPGPALTATDLATLGGDVTTGGLDGLGVGTGGSGGGSVGLGNLGVGGGRTAPAVRFGPVTATGGLPPEVVRRILRQNAGRFRFCYETALRANPSAKGGKVVTKLTIGKEGAVTVATNADESDADPAVSACVTSAVARLTFPAPEGGQVVTATQTLFFDAPDASAPPPPPPPPSFFGGLGTPYVVTRLHARYSKDALGEDLVFRAADAVVGGREMLQADGGGVEMGARKDQVNNFQGRYAIRHPWTGPVACEKPTRGIWGGPPPGSDAAAPLDTGPRSATGLGRATRGQVTLASFVDAKQVPELRLDEMKIGAAVGAAAGNAGADAAAGASATAGAAASGDAGAGPSAASEKKGCGACAAGAARGGVGVMASAVALGALTLRRRRRGR